MELQIGAHGRARLWIDESSGAVFDTVDRLERLVEAGRGLVGGSRVALEVFMPRGGRAEYGLLGGRFECDGGDRLRVRVRVAGGERALPLTDLISASLRGVRAGLPAEYASAVLEIVSSSGLPGGEVDLDEAAHDLVGSSPGLFSQLARALVALLVPGTDRSAGRVADLLVRRVLTREP